MTTKWVASDDQPKMITNKKKTSHLNAVFLIKLFQRVKRLSSFLRYLLDFPKNHISTRKDLTFKCSKFLG